MNVQVANTILFFGNQILKFETNETLEDHDIVTNSNITLVQRVAGGGAKIGTKTAHRAVGGGAQYMIGERRIDSSVKLSKDKCVLLNISNDSVSKRVQMPCGHAVTPDGLAPYVDGEIKKQKTKIICPVQGCCKEWKISEIVKRGLTARERENLETGITRNALRAQGLKECLKCSAYIQKDGNGTRMACPICKQRGVNYEFCWTCQNEWRNKNDYQICGNSSCHSHAEFQKNLNSCGTKKLYGVEVPLVRACPSCNLAINHKEACKHMLCPDPDCKTKFCYICLSVYKNRWPCGSYNTPCEAAPRQKIS